MQTTLTELVPLDLIERLLAKGLQHGADFAEVYIEKNRGNSISLEEHKIRTATYGISQGVGIRVICGTEVGYAYSDDLDPEVLLAAAAVAAAIAKGGGKHPPVPVRPKAITVPNRYPVPVVPDDVPPRAKVELLLRGDAAAHAFDSRVKQVMGSFGDQTKEILIANSDGVLADDRQVMCRLHLMAVAVDAHGERRTGSYGGGGRVPFTHFEELSPELVGKEASRMAVATLGARDCPAGPQTVVLAPGWSGVLLHEAVGHGLEADFIKKGSSLFTGKVGERVASPLVTVIDDGSVPHKRGSLNVDDEGTVGGETVLIEKGVLKGFMYDRLSAQEMGHALTGNGRRESYQHAPMPRMTNTFMAGGTHSHDEIIESVARGLYCAAFAGGQVDISNGNFVFEVNEAYVIENGKLGAPVKNATLIGVGAEALKKISMVGDDPTLDRGVGSCGKDGQSVPVGVGLPTVRIDNITVGGTDVGRA
jgi:TldD protein